MGEVISHLSDLVEKKESPKRERAVKPGDQAPGHLRCLEPGRVQNAGPTESAPLWSTQVPEPERLRPGKCIQTRASPRQFPAEQPRA